jgi:hypothetical protein
LYGGVDFIIRNLVDDMALMHGICHITKGEKDGNFSTMILPKRSASVKVKAYYQAFIAIRVFAVPLIKRYNASAVMFTARRGQFTGGKEDIKRLKGILREHLVNSTYSFICGIKSQTLKLKASFHPGRQASIEVTLEETTGHTDNSPVPY